jgi:hypothetical protein
LSHAEAGTDLVVLTTPAYIPQEPAAEWRSPAGRCLQGKRFWVELDRGDLILWAS